MVTPVRQIDVPQIPTRRTRRASNAVFSNAVLSNAVLSNAALSGSVAIVVRDVLRDREGLIGRVVGYVLIEAGIDTEQAAVSLVGIDRSGDTTVLERHGKADLVPRHAGRRAEHLDFVIDVSRRLTPGFETALGTRWWELRASVGGNRVDAVRQTVTIPSVRRVVRVANAPAADPGSATWTRCLPPPLRRADYAFDRAATATGQATVRSRGDWGVVEVPRLGGQQWKASILLYEWSGRVVGPGDPGRGDRSEVVYSRPLVEGLNTLEFELPARIAPSHAGPLLTTHYELRIHTADGRRLGARHLVEVLR